MLAKQNRTLIPPQAKNGSNILGNSVRALPPSEIVKDGGHQVPFESVARSRVALPSSDGSPPRVVS